jgi:hypothetical protein
VGAGARATEGRRQATRSPAGDPFPDRVYRANVEPRLQEKPKEGAEILLYDATGFDRRGE